MDSSSLMKDSSASTSSVKLSSSSSSQLMRSAFRCQRCCVRLGLDDSLRKLDKDSVQATVEAFKSRHAAALLDSTGDEHSQQQQQLVSSSTSSGPASSVTMQGSVDSQDSSQEFLFLSEAIGGGGAGVSSNLNPGSGPASISQNLSSRLTVFERLFEFLNANCSADHPLCAECADTLMEMQSDRVRQLEDELLCMRRYLEHLQQQQQPSEQLDDSAADELVQLEAEEAALRSELELAATELAGIRSDADAEEVKKASLKAEHAQLECEYSELKRQRCILEDELSACRNQQAYAESELNRLQNTSVLGAAFHIWYDSQMASISGFRMGKPPGSGQIDWAEVNAGWGQCALLLQAVCNKLRFESASYAVVPCASQSEIKVLANGRRLPLYSSQNRIFQDTAFDAGMSAYLSCLAELLAFVRDRYGKDRLAPYPLHPPRDIEDAPQKYSIVRAGNKDDRWTLALRLLLLDLKMLLAWMSTEPELPKLAAPAATAAPAGASSSASMPG